MAVKRGKQRRRPSIPRPHLRHRDEPAERPVLPPTEEPGRRSTAEELVRWVLVAGAERLRTNAERILVDSDVEAVHQARVATRRLRSDLRTLRPWLDSSQIEPLRSELRWLGEELGAVRDLDVMAETLGLGSASDHDASAREQALATERAAATALLVGALEGDRYRQLVDDLSRAAMEPPLAGVDPDVKAASRLGKLIRRTWRRLERSVEVAEAASAEARRHSESAEDARDPAEAMEVAWHAIRKRAKACRYAAELAAPVLDDDQVRKLAKRCEAIQTVLGEWNDAVTANRWLVEHAPHLPSEEAFGAGIRSAELQRDADERLADFPERWRKTRRAAKRSDLR